MCKVCQKWMKLSMDSIIFASIFIATNLVIFMIFCVWITLDIMRCLPLCCLLLLILLYSPIFVTFSYFCYPNIERHPAPRVLQCLLDNNKRVDKQSKIIIMYIIYYVLYIIYCILYNIYCILLYRTLHIICYIRY